MLLLLKIKTDSFADSRGGGGFRGHASAVARNNRIAMFFVASQGKLATILRSYNVGNQPCHGFSEVHRSCELDLASRSANEAQRPQIPGIWAKLAKTASDKVAAGLKLLAHLRPIVQASKVAHNEVLLGRLLKCAV
jgi:hypothetical protein